MKQLILTLSILFCSLTLAAQNQQKTPLLNDQTFKLKQVSKAPTYGYSQKNPIKVGGAKEGVGPLNQRRFLNALSGPNGEPVTYYRAGSCCFTKSKNALFGNKILLDVYRVTYVGSSDTVDLFINLYDADKLKAPKGFKIAK